MRDEERGVQVSGDCANLLSLKLLFELGLDDRAISGRIGPLGAGDADPLCIREPA